jgi:hypothetical protein
VINTSSSSCWDRKSSLISKKTPCEKLLIAYYLLFLLEYYNMMSKKIISFLTLENIAIIIISIILLQTLPFKFLGLAESVELFTKL